MTVPTKHRDALNLQSEGRLTLTKHMDGCLLMFPRPVWEAARQEIAGWSGQSKRWQRILLGNALDVEMDGAGRVLLSPELRNAAGMKPDSKVMLLGMGSHFEVWDAASHEQYEQAPVAPEAIPDEVKNFSF